MFLSDGVQCITLREMAIRMGLTDCAVVVSIRKAKEGRLNATCYGELVPHIKHRKRRHQGLRGQYPGEGVGIPLHIFEDWFKRYPTESYRRTYGQTERHKAAATPGPAPSLATVATPEPPPRRGILRRAFAALTALVAVLIPHHN